MTEEDVGFCPTVSSASFVASVSRLLPAVCCDFMLFLSNAVDVSTISMLGRNFLFLGAFGAAFVSHLIG